MNAPIRLWLVEDRVDFREFYSAALAAYGFPCERRFGSAEEVIEVLRQSSGPDLLLLDNGLPGICGAVAVKIVKTLSPSTLVFVLSSLKNYCDAAEALGGGASAYFERSDSIERITISMRVALSSRGVLPNSKGMELNAVGTTA